MPPPVARSCSQVHAPRRRHALSAMSSPLPGAAPCTLVCSERCVLDVAFCWVLSHVVMVVAMDGMYTCPPARGPLHMRAECFADATWRTRRAVQVLKVCRAIGADERTARELSREHRDQSRNGGFYTVRVRRKSSFILCVRGSQSPKICVIEAVWHWMDSPSNTTLVVFRGGYLRVKSSTHARYVSYKSVSVSIKCSGTRTRIVIRSQTPWCGRKRHNHG